MLNGLILTFRVLPWYKYFNFFCSFSKDVGCVGSTEKSHLCRDSCSYEARLKLRNLRIKAILGPISPTVRHFAAAIGAGVGQCRSRRLCHHNTILVLCLSGFRFDINNWSLLLSLIQVPFIRLQQYEREYRETDIKCKSYSIVNLIIRQIQNTALQTSREYIRYFILFHFQKSFKLIKFQP